MQDFYAWPNADQDAELDDVAERLDQETSHGLATALAGTANSPAGGFDNLNPTTQRRFIRGGLGGSRGTRTPRMARRLYEGRVPKHLRNAGDPAVSDFVMGQDFSHKVSVAKRPDLAKAPHNTVLEDSSLNRARGAKNMTRSEVKAAQTAQRLRGITIGARAALKNGLRGGYVAGAMEALISVPENVLHWKRGRKTGNQAVKDAAKSAATTAGIGVVAADGLTFVSLGPLAAPLAAGGTLWWVSGSVHRIYKAAQQDLPLDGFRVFFCKDRDCRLQYAQAVVDASSPPESVKEGRSG